MNRRTTILVADLPGLLEFGMEWVTGSTACGAWPQVLAWREYRPVVSTPVLPLYTGMGFALGVAFLAKQHEFIPDGSTHAHFDGRRFEIHSDEGSMSFDVTDTPTLADIPEHCATCGGNQKVWAATPQSTAPCPDCLDGTNPNRTAQALAACMRQGEGQ